MPAPSRPARASEQPLDDVVSARIRQLHADGASLHTIAAALNRVDAPNPAGVRWHAQAVARHVADAAPDPVPG